MKSIRILYVMFAFMFINSSNGQVYEFDKIVTYKFSTSNYPNQEKTSLFNSKDYSYHMKIYRRNDSLISSILDTKESLIHYFNINNSDSLLFMKSVNLKKNDKEYTVEFSNLKKMKDVNELTFKILNNRKRRKAKYKLNFKETEQNFLPIFRLSAFEILLFTEIDSPFNFIVLKAKGRNVSGNKIEYELVSIKDLTTTITLPGIQK